MKQVFSLLLSLCLFIGLAFATDYPITVTDDLGNELTLESEPMRIVTMIPSHTETVCALNACDKLVGVDEYSNYPEMVMTLSNLGNGFAPNVEAIVAIEPDLVLVDESSGIATALEGLGLNVYAGTAQTFEEVFEKFEVIGQLINREAEAGELSASVMAEAEGIAGLVANAEQPTVFYELDSTLYSVSPSSFVGEILARAGANNIVPDDLGDFPQLDPEFIVEANPDIIILADAPYGETVDSLTARPGWSALGAVESGKVYELSQEDIDAINRPGPRVGQAVRILAQLLHPDLID